MPAAASTKAQRIHLREHKSNMDSRLCHLSEPGPDTADPPGELDILLHDCHALGVDCTEVPGEGQEKIYRNIFFVQ
ncbi:hypothetical protein BC936DRAFT_145852 [Jimgerdemannia flammicorona]|uniref:Uncharacterized protein n=1 Tax=Jimgerdemannia flammicorona TaxID=994334 RepID=A0A433D9M9_9FUNG|nr:hypothetical protein BC936DRAFT_145852 [Jimgerdemannia flammicorona]